MPFRPFTAIVAAALASAAALAQPLQPVAAVPAEIAALPPFVRPDNAAIFRIDYAALNRTLAAASALPQGDATPHHLLPTIDIPWPARGGGALVRFRIARVSIMEPALAQRYPTFQTYRLWGVDDPAAVGCLDLTTHGLRGMIRSSQGAVFIDPWSAQQSDFASIYFLKDLTGRDAVWTCHTDHAHGAARPGDPPVADPTDPLETPQGTGGLPLRAYRLAMACSGEYGAYQATVQGRAPNPADALAALVTVTNRCNVVFEADLGVRFVLVANNDQLAFFDPATDPYPDPDPNCTSDPAADCSSPYLNLNITVLNQIIGSANYDIGHVLTRVRGGVAYLRAACGNNKGGGVSGIPRGGENEPASALVPLHELGHQFGANHTFNGVLGRCSANINGTTNWEPGGGSTLLAYPGACPVGGPLGGDGSQDTDNLVQFADPTFHTGSLIEMRTFLALPRANCHTDAPTANAAAPVITSTTPSGPIPPLTPFALTAQVTDDGSTLAYAWDQLDIGPAQRLTGPTAADNGLSALFRTYLPDASPTRTIPRWPDLLAGTPYIGERMPSVPGSVRKFRLTARDNQGRSVSSDLVNLTITGETPFVVTAPGAGASVEANAINVAWNAAAFQAAPLAVTSVRVTLSFDGGQTFPHVLAAAAPNTGSATFSVVGTPAAGGSADARVRVAPNGFAFFNVSPAFDLRRACPSDFDRSGIVNPDDLSDYIACYFTFPPCDDADFNADGTADPDDLSDFIAAFFAGC